MPSPFPGMDPWLEGEAISTDLQFLFSVWLSGALNGVLPKGCYSRTFRHEWWDVPRRRIELAEIVMADRVGVPMPETLPAAGGFVQLFNVGVDVWKVAEPEHIKLTVIEVISRDVRTIASPARVLFEQRQRNDMMNRMNRVEIDLFRFGTPVSPIACTRRGQSPVGDGQSVTVFRGARPSLVKFYPFNYQIALPVVSVPLGSEFGEVELELQPLLDRCYTGGGYDRWLDYSQPCDPPLTAEQREWAESIPKAKGLLK